MYHSGVADSEDQETRFPKKFNAIEGRFSEIELSCLSSAFGFPSQLFVGCPLEIHYVQKDISSSGYVYVSDLNKLLVAGGVLNSSMNRTVNNHDGAYNAKVFKTAIRLIDTRSMTFDDCRHSVTAFKLYQGENSGLPLEDFYDTTIRIERRELMKACKLAGRVAPLNLVTVALRSITQSRKLPRRLQQYDFLTLLSTLPKLTQVYGGVIQDSSEFVDKDALFALCDFHDLMRTEDERRSRRLSAVIDEKLSKHQKSNKSTGRRKLREGSKIAPARQQRKDSEAGLPDRYFRTPSHDDKLVQTVKRTIALVRPTSSIPTLNRERPKTAPILRRARKNVSKEAFPTVTKQQTRSLRKKEKVNTNATVDPGFEEFWSLSKGKICESDALRWSPKDNMDHETMQNFFKYQGRPPPQKIVTGDQILEMETTTEDLRWKIETKNYRRPEIVAVQPSDIDWGLLHPNIRSSISGQSGGETHLKSLYQTRDEVATFGEAVEQPKFQPNEEDDLESNRSNSLGSMDVSSDEGPSSYLQDSHVFSAFPEYVSESQEKSGDPDIQKHGKSETIALSDELNSSQSSTRPGSANRPGSASSRPSSAKKPMVGRRLSTTSLRIGSLAEDYVSDQTSPVHVQKSGWLRPRQKPKPKEKGVTVPRTVDAPVLMKRNWRVAGDWIS